MKYIKGRWVETPEPRTKPMPFEFNTARATKVAGVPVEAQPLASLPGPRNAQGLRTDGPTLDEWVKAGYPAKAYPPHGYAKRD